MTGLIGMDFEYRGFYVELRRHEVKNEKTVSWTISKKHDASLVRTGESRDQGQLLGFARHIKRVIDFEYLCVESDFFSNNPENADSTELGSDDTVVERVLVGVDVVIPEYLNPQKHYRLARVIGGWVLREVEEVANA